VSASYLAATCTINEAKRTSTSHYIAVKVGIAILNQISSRALIARIVFWAFLGHISIHFNFEFFAQTIGHPLPDGIKCRDVTVNFTFGISFLAHVSVILNFTLDLNIGTYNFSMIAVKIYGKEYWGMMYESFGKDTMPR